MEAYTTMLFTLTILLVTNANAKHKKYMLETTNSADMVINAFIIVLALYVGINLSGGVSG